jgi:RsiW-degrading membrane proteinase PrsW (M82 family)
VVFWFKFFQWEDRAEPEPKKLLIKAFLLGCLGAVLLSIIEYFVFYFLLGPRAETLLDVSNLAASTVTGATFVLLIGAGILEETGKFILLKEYIYDKADFNQIADGVFYGATLALGFSFVENIFYFIGFLHQGNTVFLASAAAIRGLLSVSVHILATSISGLALGRMKFRMPHSWKPVILALALAALLHASYNVLIQFQIWGLLGAVLLLGLVLRYILHSINLPDSKVVWRLVTPKKDI